MTGLYVRTFIYNGGNGGNCVVDLQDKINCAEARLWDRRLVSLTQQQICGVNWSSRG